MATWRICRRCKKKGSLTLLKGVCRSCRSDEALLNNVQSRQETSLMRKWLRPGGFR